MKSPRAAQDQEHRGAAGEDVTGDGHQIAERPAAAEAYGLHDM
jgi:hypothetical protein